MVIARALRVLALVVMAAFAGPAAAQTSVDEAADGIVRVVVILASPSGQMLHGSGSGFVVAPNLVITNAHVVALARQRPEFGIAVVPPEGDGLIPARIVRYSQDAELALLEFSGGPPMPALTISTVEPQAGDGVVALGYPDVDYQGASGADLLRPAPASRTSGEIASLRDRAPTGEPIPTVNHSAIISSGSSGGPLLDACGGVIGVNSWHVSGADTRETRGVSTRAAQLLEFLDNAGVTAALSDERCLSVAERMEADRAATVSALQTQNQELASKLQEADRITRIAFFILIGGTLALFVAVCVLGALLLSRRHAAHAHEPYDQRGRRVGVMTILGGAAIAAILIVAVGLAFMRTRGGAALIQPQQVSSTDGAYACVLDRHASVGAEGVSDMSFTASGSLCVNERTLYARDGDSFSRALVLGESRALDFLSVDLETGEFRRDRYSLDSAAFAAATQAAAPFDAGRGCSGDAEAIAERNRALRRFVEGEPSQHLVWRCTRR